MFKDFPAFVPSKVCLACDGCCRFREENSVWRPRLAGEEADRLRISRQLRNTALAADDRLVTVSYQDVRICYFLEPRGNTCGIYPARPWECQLYPFLLARHNGRCAVLLHLLCPYAQQAWGQDKLSDYLGTLRDFLTRDAVRGFLTRNRELFGDYTAFAAEWELLFYLDGVDDGTDG